MSRIAFVFPGQGAQYTGMAKDFYEKFSVSREVFEKASKVSGLNVETLCFEENEDFKYYRIYTDCHAGSRNRYFKSCREIRNHIPGKCRTEPWRIRCTR